MKALGILLAAAIAAGVSGKALAATDSIEIGTSSQHLSDGYANADRSYARVIERGSDGHPTLYEQFSEGDRYGLHDREMLVGASLRPAPGTIVNVEFSASPTHAVAPSFAGYAGVERRFAQGYGATLGVAKRTYTSTNASIETIGADRYMGDYRFAYTASFSQLSGTLGTAVTHAVSATRYDRRGGDVGLHAYAGRDVESAGPGVLVMNVQGLSLGGHVAITHDVAIGYGFETFAQGRLYHGSGFTIGVRRTF